MRLGRRVIIPRTKRFRLPPIRTKYFARQDTPKSLDVYREHGFHKIRINAYIIDPDEKNAVR